METNYPQGLQYAIAQINGTQAILERGIVPSRRKIIKAKQARGVQADQEPVHVTVTYYLLRPQQPETATENLMVRDMVAVCERDVCITTKLIGKCAEGQHKGNWVIYK